MSPLNEMIVDNLHAMCQQENNAYRLQTSHLEQQQQPQQQHQGHWLSSLSSSSSSSPSPCSSEEYPVDISLYLTWRNQMIGWNYALASTCHFSNETVEIAVSLTDRFVAVKTELLTDAYRYQLACMASLYIAAKINELQCFSPHQIEYLSRGRFHANEIESMEQEILPALQWRVHPPTASSFCRSLFELLPIYLVPEKKKVLEVADSHIQLAIANETFLTIKPSTLAIASLMRSLQCFLTPSALNQSFSILCQGLRLNESFTFPKIQGLQEELRDLALQSMNNGFPLNETMLAAYQNQPPKTEQCKYNNSSSNNSNTVGETNTSVGHLSGAKSPRGVVTMHRSISVLV